MLTPSSIKDKKELPKDFSKRRGRFVVGKELLNHANKDFMNFMSNFLIVRAEFMYHSDAIDYHAISTLFDPIDEFEEAPKYEFKITKKDNNEIEIKAIKQQKGKKLLRLLRKIDG